VRAAVTLEASSMAVVDAAEPAAPGPGEAIVRPEAVGICGSDFHFYLGELGLPFPRIQGHEVSALVDEVGEGCAGLSQGDRVALWPIVPCGRCYPCRIGRESACASIQILGIHFDGGLQECLRMPASHLVPVGDLEPATAAFVEPMSIAVRTVSRGRVEPGERVVILGAGPIGQAVSIAARDRGASVLVADRIAERLGRARALGAEAALTAADADLHGAVRDWAGEDGPAVVVDATGAPGAIRAAVEVVATAGRVVVAGISDEEVRLPVAAFTAKELDVLGTSTCSPEDFRQAVDLVRRRRGEVSQLVTHEFPLERAPEALEFAMRNPHETMKVVVRLDAAGGRLEGGEA
jgi:L-gulonate 5-dehydrogenase